MIANKGNLLPTKEEIEELVSFLPRLYAPGLKAIKTWGGGEQVESDVFQMPYPIYDKIVEDFFRTASQECWCDYGYEPVSAGEMLLDEDLVRHSTLAQMKTMLTFCVRGEHFCDGHWARMIEEGHIRRLLERLVELGSETSNRQDI